MPLKKSDRRHTATAARASEPRVVVEDILESVTDAVFAIDHDWRFSYVNAAGERLARCARADLLGAIVWDAFPNALGTEYKRAFRAAMDHASASTSRICRA
jgi:PAS domain-containing protein